MKKVSVIVPVYNVEKYLVKCLDSLVKQTLNEIEIIVVNDGTKDNSQTIIDDYQARYPKKIKSIKKENGGQGSARNLGLKFATGEYVAYIDSDDYVAHNMFELLYKNAKSNNSDIAICGNYVVNEDYKILKEEVYKNKNSVFSVATSPDILFDKMAVWNKIYKLDFLKNLNISFRSKKWYEDFDFSTIVLLNATNISVVEKPLYYYVLRSGSTMNNSNIDRNLEIIDAFECILKYTKSTKKFKDFFSEIEFLAITHVYLYSIVRISSADVNYKKKKFIINKLKQYVKFHFKNYAHNKYIKTELSFFQKIIYWLIRLKMYYIIYILFKIKNRKM